MATPYKFSNSIVIFFFFSSILPGCLQAEPHFVSVFCVSDTGNYTENSPYQSNLNSALSNLSTKGSSNNFYNITSGEGIDKVYALYYCRGDIDSQDCNSCVQAATKKIVTECPVEKESLIWFKECTLRYANRSIFSVFEEFPNNWNWNTNNVSNPQEFEAKLGDVMNSLIQQAAYTTGFAMGQADVTQFQTVYCLVQCSPDLIGALCFNCLKTALKDIPTCCGSGSVSAMINYPSCRVMYDLTPIVKPINPPPPTPQPSGNTSSVDKGKGAKFYAIVAAVPVAAALFLVGGIWFCLDRKKAKNIPKDDTREYEIEGLVQFDLATIKAATTNFSVAHRLGEGGFGAVYRGKLQNGQDVAIKRLSQDSRQGINEFSNEVRLVAKLQHRNLVKLVGFCAEGEERLLVYEFMPNLSLDKYLFDQSKSKYLRWEERYKITLGIARGIQYLHEDSRLKIIHRDLKASNILLDEDMNPKIADFGTARLVVVDHTQANTTKIVGTFGYMAPEYAMAGRFSIKSDVYSFGVMLLEIVTGQSNSKLYQLEQSEGLLLQAWRMWKQGAIEELIDPMLERTMSRMEVIRCIQVALLCVQDDPESRPTMQVVLLMLNINSVELPSPSVPSPLFQNHNIPTPSTNLAREYQQQQTGSQNSFEVWHLEKDLYPR